MKAWALTATLAAICGAAVGAVAISAHLQSSAESMTNALAAAERVQATPKRAPSADRAPRVPTTRAPQTLAAGAASAVADAPQRQGADAAPVAAEAAAKPSDTPAAVRFELTLTINGAPVYVPEACSGPYDVILHFHGAHPYVRELVEKSGIFAVVAVFNAGNGAEKYSQAYHAGGTLSSLLRQVATAAAPLCPGADAKPRRVALSAWSAGYGGVEKLVSRAEDRERVDAVLLADGLHAAFMDPYKRTFAPNALQAFRDFGELAKRGQKLFAITHSSIMTDGYGSTTECSRLLLQALDVPPQGRLVSGAAGNFSIEGSAGDDKAAHVAQLRQMDESLLSKLRARWQ
jgi:hypothetical protein